MAYVSGTAGSVAYVSGGTTVVAGVHEWSIDVGQETPETTAFGDQWRTHVAGIREWSASMGMHGDPAASSQNFITNLQTGGSASVEFRFFAGTNYYAGSGIVTGHSPEVAFDGIYEDSFDLQGSGPLTFV